MTQYAPYFLGLLDIANHIIEERLTWPVRAVMLGSAGLYGQLLPDQGFFKAPYPARAAVEVARLPKDVLVEIKVTALVE